MAKNKIQNEKVQEAKRLINLNEDSRYYFYEKADETWLKWLWKNGFFDVLKKKAEDPSRFSYRTPELRYLVRMAKLNPEVVTDIMLDIPISGEAFNPEVIDQFLHICGCLPGEQLAKLTGKIQTENWPALMQMYNQWGMDYGKMFESLEKSGHYEELMVLASVVLDLRDDWETKAKEKFSDVTPFCLTNLSYSKVFYYLSNINEKYIEHAIDLSISVLKKLTTFSDEDRKTPSVFKQKDIYPLYDVDVFAINIRPEYHGSGRDDVREVVALVKALTERALEQQCVEKAKAIFEHKFATLPDSWLMWRIRLFVLSLCPLELMSDLKKALNRIFKEDRYSELIMGAEYEKALMKAFPLMGKEDQSGYVNKAKDLFSHDSDNEDSSKTRDGSHIFSVIVGNLSDDQVAELIDAGFKINPGYVPTPLMGMTQVGFVQSKGPLNQEEFRDTSVRTIVDNLKGNWSPARLIELDVQRDFLNPLNAEGMGKLLREDVKTRLQEYLEYANDFLDPENLDLHYLYSLISGFADTIDGNTEPLKNADWVMLIDFCLRIIQSWNEQPVEQLEYEIYENDVWLGRWNAVCAAIASLLNKVLRTNGKKLGFEWKTHRSHILLLIEYLFEYPDPIPEAERIDSEKMTEPVEGQKQLLSDPFTLAINSIRGQAFELFVLAVELDREEDDGFDKLSPDIKNMYESLLSKEETRAIMFMFGRHVALFFFQEKKWLKSMLSQIFKTDEKKEYLYIAAWEGYLSNILYQALFEDEDFQKLYKRAVVLTDKNYPNQKHFIDPDKEVAHHFALAYMAFDFDFGNELFDYFWKDGTITHHIAFVDKLGRFFVSSENPRALKLMREDENARNKLNNMWSWLLENYSDPNVFDGIGFWINLDKGIFKANELASYLAKTLARTNGFLKWDIGLQDNIVALAKGSPKDTVEIARLYLLEGGVRKGINSLHFILDEKWVEAFRILNSQPATKLATLSLINDLIREGGSLFWPLKEVIKRS